MTTKDKCIEGVPTCGRNVFKKKIDIKYIILIKDNTILHSTVNLVNI